MESSTVEVISTSKGRPCLVVDNYQHRQHRKTNKNIYWLCINERQACKGRVKTTHQYDVLNKTPHICEVNVAEITIKKKLLKCRQRVREEMSVPVHQIFDEEMAEIYAGGYDFKAKIPLYESAKTALYSERRKQSKLLTPHERESLQFNRRLVSQTKSKLNKPQKGNPSLNSRSCLDSQESSSVDINMSQAENSSVAKNQVPSSSILEFLMLIGKLKHLKRTGWVLKNVPDCEHVAGHMYRMSVMAFLLDKDSCPNLDREKCIKMALVHDMAECIVGDLTPFCGVSKEEKHKKELEAMKRLSSLIGEKVGQEFLQLFTEYEEKQTIEAKAVSDLDKFDMILQAYEYEKESEKKLNLQDFFSSTEGSFENNVVLEWVNELKSIRGATSESTVEHVNEPNNV